MGPEPVYARDPARFVRLLLERAIADLSSKASGEHDVFFDRGIPDIVGYFELFDLDASAAWEAAHVHRYNDPVFVFAEWPEIYTTDVDRRMTFEQSAAFGRRVREIYAELGYALVDVRPGTPDERAAFIRDRTLTIR